MRFERQYHIGKSTFLILFSDIDTIRFRRPRALSITVIFVCTQVNFPFWRIGVSAFTVHPILAKFVSDANILKLYLAKFNSQFSHRSLISWDQPSPQLEINIQTPRYQLRKQLRKSPVENQQRNCFIGLFFHWFLI